MGAVNHDYGKYDYNTALGVTCRIPPDYELPIDPSSLTRWRKRVGEKGVETLLAVSIKAARRGDVIQKSSAQRVIIDTTVMLKAIAHPTDSRLLDKNRQHLVKATQQICIPHDRTTPSSFLLRGRAGNA